MKSTSEYEWRKIPAVDRISRWRIEELQKGKWDMIVGGNSLGLKIKSFSCTISVVVYFWRFIKKLIRCWICIFDFIMIDSSLSVPSWNLVAEEILVTILMTSFVFRAPQDASSSISRTLWFSYFELWQKSLRNVLIPWVTPWGPCLLVRYLDSCRIDCLASDLHPFS